VNKGKKVIPVLLTEHHAMKTYWGSRGIAPHILDLGTKWRSVVSFTPRPLYPQRKGPLYPLDRRLGGPQSRSGRGGEEKNPKLLPGLESPIIQAVAQRYTTQLSRTVAVNILHKQSRTANKGWSSSMVWARGKLLAVKKKFVTKWYTGKKSSNITRLIKSRRTR
jgi:hypothetical protein